MSDIDFGAIPVAFKETGGFLINLVTIQSHPVPLKIPIHVKNEGY